MPRYAISASYVPEHWDRVVAHPNAIVAGFRRIVESLGGTLESFDYTFGEHDLLAIIEVPDLTTQTAVSIALASTSVFKALTTRELIDPEVITTALNAIRVTREAEDKPS